MSPTWFLRSFAAPRRTALVAVVAGAALLLPALVLAQGASDGPRTQADPVPRLGAHRFGTTALLRGPFIRTSLRNQIGVGASSGLDLGTIAVGDTAIRIDSGDLIYTDITLGYQHAVKDWLGFTLRLAGGGRLGTETSSLIAEGVSVATIFDVGWLVRLWQTDDMMISGGLYVDDRSYTIVDLAGFIDRIIEDGGLRPGNTLVRTVPVLTTMTDLRYAYGVNDLIGLVAEGSLGYGESVKPEASSEWYHALGVAVDFDLNPRTSVPVGIALGTRLFNFPMGDPSAEGNVTTLLLRVSHTGTSNLNFGVDLESRWINLIQVEDKLRYTSLTLDFDYYF